MDQEQHDRPAGEPEPSAEQADATRETGTPEGEVVPEETGQGKTNAERLGDATLKFATDAAYAVAGFAGLVGERAKAFYDEQRAEYAKTHPNVESPGAREFLEQLGSHLNRFVDDINRGFRDLSDKGREVVNSNKPETPEGGQETGKTAPAQPKAEDPGAEETKAAEEPRGEEYGEEYKEPRGE